MARGELKIVFRPASDLRKKVTPSRAKFYDVYLDRKLLYRDEFPTVKTPTDLKLDIVEDALRVFTKIVKEAPLKEIKKKAKPKKKPKLKQLQKFDKPISKVPERVPQKALEEIIKDEVPLIGEAKVVKSKFHGVVDKVIHTPIITTSIDYIKKLVNKTVYSEFKDMYFDLEILDFKFRKPIKITNQNKEKIRVFLRKYFTPHFKDFYKSHKFVRKFLSRFTFLRRIPISGEEQGGGFGTPRYKVFTQMEFLKEFLYEPLSKKNFLRSYDSRGLLKNDYVMASFNKEIYLTGFTIEAIINEQQKEA